MNHDNLLAYFLDDNQKSFLLEMSRDIHDCENDAELLSCYESFAGDILGSLMDFYGITLGFDVDEIYERNNLVAAKKHLPELYKCLPYICLSLNLGVEHHEKIREAIDDFFPKRKKIKVAEITGKLYKVRSWAENIKKVHAMFADVSTLHEGLTYFEVELTPEQIIGLSEKYDVMIQGGNEPLIYLDEKGKRFCKR